MTIPGLPFFTYKLVGDLATGATGIWSLRKARMAYDGYCCEMRRDSDNTSTNVYFDSSGNLSTSSFTSVGSKLSVWLGSASGYIRQLYDQTGNTNNTLIQLTTANQPQIAASGVINTLGGRAAMTFNGSTTYLSSASTIVMPVTMSLFTVSVSINTSLFIEHSPDTNSHDGFYIYGMGSAAADITRSGTSVQATSASWSGSGNVALALTYDGSTITAWKRNISQATGSGSVTGNATQTLYVGARGGSSLFMTGSIAEILLFNNSVQSSQRSAIFVNQENFYGV